MIASTITDISTLCIGLATLVSAVGAFILALKNAGRIENVHQEVRAGNGKTAAKLTELSEGRRVAKEVLHGERTAEEQRYVDMVTKDDFEQRADDAAQSFKNAGSSGSKPKKEEQPMNALIAALAPADLKDNVVRAVKATVATFVGVLGANLVNWTNLTAVKAAGIAAAGTAFTIALNAVLTWVNTPTA